MSTPTERPPLPAHPSGNPQFRLWFKEFSEYIGMINPGDPLGDGFSRQITALMTLGTELVYEIESTVDRSQGSVYDRSDYLVREILRTNRVIVVVGYVRSVAAALGSGRAVINKSGALVVDDKALDTRRSVALLRELPTLFYLLFTATETIGIVNIDDLLRACSDILDYALRDANSYVPLTPSHFDIFTGVVGAVKSCIDGLKHLNTSLFFTLFNDLGILDKLIRVSSESYNAGRSVVSSWCAQCAGSYATCSQAADDIRRLCGDAEFASHLKYLIENVIDPLVHKDRSNRARFRALLHLSKQLD